MNSETMASLEFVAGDIAGTIFELKCDEVVLGRLPNCDVVLEDSTVSRRHARIFQKNARYYLEDLNSYHGTMINGRRIYAPEPLTDRDQIQISQHRFDFKDPRPRLSDPLDSGITGGATVVKARTALLDEQNARNKLRALMEIIHNVGVSLDVQQLFPQIMDSVFRIFPQASRGFILLAEGPDAQLVPHAVKYRRDQAERPPIISRTIAERVIDNGEAILSEDTGEDERFNRSESVHNLQLSSFICAPLLGDAHEPLGLIHVDTQDLRNHFTPDDLEVLINVANLAGKSLAHTRLHETRMMYLRRQHDLATAKQVQLHFLPNHRPAIDGYDLADTYRAVDEVGGDYFGYLPLPDGRWAIAIGDVAGKGVSAALLMARFCSDVRYCLATSGSPRQAIIDLNQQIHRQEAYDRFVTFGLIVLDPRTHSIETLYAGHHPALHYRAVDRVVTPVGAAAAGPPLGVNPEWDYECSRTALAPDDALLLYTDGVCDTQNRDGKLYGNARIRHVLDATRSAQGHLNELLRSLANYSRGASQTDDLCAICLQRQAV